MTFLIETTDGEIIEVSNLLDKHGCETTYIPNAVVCILKFAEDNWISTEINDRPIHRLQ